MTPVATRSELSKMLKDGDLLALGARAVRSRSSQRVGFLEDDARAWDTEAQGPGVRWLDVRLDEGTDLDEACARLREGRRRHPRAWLHGGTPGWLSGQGKDALSRLGAAGLDSLALYTGPLKGACPHSKGWADCLQLDFPKVASLVYSPEDPLEWLVERLSHLAQGRALKALVCLPAGPGDLMLVSGATTAGNLDMRVSAAARLALGPVHVRASWAALGWKVAQVALAFGADELAGFGLEESLAYPRRARPASLVSAEEVLAGIREALLEPVEVHRCDWES